MSVCSVDRQQTLSRIDGRRLSVDGRYLQLSIGRDVMSAWVGVACCRSVLLFRSENFFKVLIGKRKVVERQGRCCVETLAPSVLLVTSVKLFGTAILLRSFVYIVFMKARS